MRLFWSSALLCLSVCAVRQRQNEPDLDAEEKALEGDEASSDPTEAKSALNGSSSGKKIELRADQAPGVRLHQSWGTGTWVHPRHNGSLERQMNKANMTTAWNLGVEEINFVDQEGKNRSIKLHHAPKTLVAKKWWEVLKKSKKDSNYTVKLMTGDSYSAEGKFVIVPFFLGIAPAVLTACVSLCFLPCFLCTLCGFRGQTALTESHKSMTSVQGLAIPQPAGTQPCAVAEPASMATNQPDTPAGSPTGTPAAEGGATNQANEQKVDSNPEHVVLKLKETWLTRILDSKMASLSLLLFSISMCAGRLIELCYIYKLVASEPVLAAAEYTLPAVNLGLCIIVILGDSAARQAQSELALAQGAFPKLKEAIQTGWRKTVLLPFGLKLLAVLGVTWFMFLVMLHQLVMSMVLREEGLQGVEVVAAEPESAEESLVEEAARMAPYIDICCHQGLLFIMMLKFMLDAFIVARVVVAHVDAVTEALEKPLDKVDLKQIHASCVKLAHETLPNLATISGPTCGVAVLTWSYALVVLLQEALTGAATASDQACFMFAVVIFCHLPIGLACLLLPAEVSDACEKLMKQLNQLRVETDLEKHKQICLTEAFIKESNQGQGLGFILYPTGMVVNKRIILTAGAKLLGYASILFSFFWKLCEIQQSATKSLANVDS